MGYQKNSNFFLPTDFVIVYFLCSSNKETCCFLLIIGFLFLLILFDIICSNILALPIYTQRTKTSTVINIQGQICFSIVASLQTSGLEALPTDALPAYLILSQGFLAELNTRRQTNDPLGSSADLIPPRTCPSSEAVIPLYTHRALIQEKWFNY